MVGSHSRVRLVEFDCICLRRSVVSEKEEKKGNKEKKERWKTKRCLQRNQTVATVDNRPRLLAGEGVLEETKLRLRKERGFCRDRRYSTWASGGRMNSAKEILGVK